LFLALQCGFELSRELIYSRLFMNKTIITLLCLALSLPVYAADSITVYSARKEHLIKPLFDAYTANTGVKIRYITDKAAPLLARLKAEGTNTPADMLMTVDAGNLWQAAEAGVLAPVESELLNRNVPAHLRDPGNQWFGLSIRARTIVYSTARVKPADLSSYEDLAEPKWQGRLCLRTSKKVYNQSLVATMIAHHGESKTREIVQGWVRNLATQPFSNDTRLMEAIAAGQCDVGIVNTYYFGRLQKQDPAVKLALFWPNQDSTGVHINISGAGITRHAKHRDAAIKLLEWLSSAEAQQQFAALNMEYPVNPTVSPDAVVAAWGEFTADELNVAQAGRLQTEAIKLMDRAGYR
jgi:iron(III) transport system substrate-binding protein